MVKTDVNPVVSIVIPTYNRSVLAGRAIKSVLNQTYQDFEIIVIDDASKDNTEEVVKNFDDGRIRYIKHVRNKGGSAARNTGVKASKGQYVAFLDSDDEWLPDKLEKQIKVFENAPSRVGIVYTGFIREDGHTGHPRKQHIPVKKGCIYKDILVKNYVGTASTVMVERKCFERSELFDQDLPSCQDWDMWIRLANKWEFDFVPEALIKYYEHGNRITADHRSRLEGHKAILAKYRDDIEVHGHKFKAMYYFNFGNLLCHLGDMKLGRRYLLKAFLNQPWNPKHFIYFLASIFGEKMYLKLARIKRWGKEIFHFV